MGLQENERRELDTFVSAEEFARSVLKLRGERSVKAAYHISEAEVIISSLEPNPTSDSEDYREANYRPSDRRKWLRNKILDELYYMERLDNDDEIRLGHGGSKPEEVSHNSEAYIVIGPPASGKSGIAIKLADKYGAYMLDSDYAKRKFPEFHGYIGGASLVHKEADDLVFEPENSLAEYCLYNKVNVVVPLVGRTIDSVEDFCNMLKMYGYKINIVAVSLNSFTCVLRAYKRFLETKRYVPLSYVFDQVGNKPDKVYDELKNRYASDSSFKSFTRVSTDVKRGQLPTVLDSSDNSPEIFNRQ